MSFLKCPQKSFCKSLPKKKINSTTEYVYPGHIRKNVLYTHIIFLACIMFPFWHTFIHARKRKPVKKKRTEINKPAILQLETLYIVSEYLYTYMVHTHQRISIVLCVYVCVNNINAIGFVTLILLQHYAIYDTLIFHGWLYQEVSLDSSTTFTYE